MTRKQDYEAAFENGRRATIRALLRRGARYDRAEEIAQAAWSRAWERRHQCKSADAVPWVISIALRMLWDDNERSSRLCSLGPEHDRQAAAHIDERRIEIDLALQKSGQRHGDLLRRVYLDEEPTAVLAGELGISAPALHARVSRALRAVRMKVA